MSPRRSNRIPARSHCPFLVLTPGISAQFLEADLDMSRANTGRFAGVFGMTCEREQLLAMQKVEGSNPFSRSQNRISGSAFAGLCLRPVLWGRTANDCTPRPTQINGTARHHPRRAGLDPTCALRDFRQSSKELAKPGEPAGRASCPKRQRTPVGERASSVLCGGRPRARIRMSTRRAA
jgi:hypothetical protein